MLARNGPRSILNEERGETFHRFAVYIGDGARRVRWANTKSEENVSGIEMCQTPGDEAPASKSSLMLWVIYDNPLDTPGAFVARKFISTEPTGEVRAALKIEYLRRLLPDGLVRMTPDPRDDRAVVEVWF
ncbi:hypothetical protein ACO2TQ_40170 [Burkholderia sp. OKR4-1]|uniref:hypothetical protein n=1 Tax=Burkholderia TaxID=32008 RepID=UPI0024C0F93E|nr:hypothetical protein [Burkholderia contaminans]MDK1000949.1 hypothetical protein [Burkholderia contaminans]